NNLKLFWRGGILTPDEVNQESSVYRSRIDCACRRVPTPIWLPSSVAAPPTRIRSAIGRSSSLWLLLRNCSGRRYFRGSRLCKAALILSISRALALGSIKKRGCPYVKASSACKRQRPYARPRSANGRHSSLLWRRSV